MRINVKAYRPGLEGRLIIHVDEEVIGNSVLEIPRHIKRLTDFLRPGDWKSIQITVTHDDP